MLNQHSVNNSLAAKGIQLLAIIILFTAFSPAQENVARMNSQFVKPLRGNGLCFTENQGQMVDMQQHLRPDILYKGEFGGADIYIRKMGVSYVLSNMAEVMNDINERIESIEEEMKRNDPALFNKQKLKDELTQKALIKLHRVDVDFENCNPNPEIVTLEQLEGYTNYYYSHCPQGVTNVNSFNQIIAQNVYPNIDVKYYASTSLSTGASTSLSTGGLKYDIVVRPGGDPDQIKLKYIGVRELKLINENSSAGLITRLRVETDFGELNEYMPKVYQNINGKIVDVKAEYNLAFASGGGESKDIVTFKLGNYNSAFPLVLDPWFSYYGGISSDGGNDVFADPSGNVVFTGITSSTDFPVSPGAFQIAISTNSDAFVVKMDPNGVRLWATYFGGTHIDDGNGITTDNVGNILVTGSTQSTDLPVGSSGINIVHQSTNGGSRDAFLLKLSPTGARLFATYYGGLGSEDNASVASDGTNMYMYGQTISPNAISTPGAFQTGLADAVGDVFVTKFTSTGARIWATYLGGTAWEGCRNDITYDPVNSYIYIAGYTQSTNFPVAAGYDMTAGGGMDAFLVKLDPSGNRIWATYYGGTGYDGGFGIATDASGDIILAGYTESASSISSVGAQQTVYGAGNMDGYIVKFNSNCVRLWGTYLGGNTYDVIQGGVVVDKNKNIYVFGEWEEATSGNYPISSCAYQTAFGGVEDQFIAKYSPAGKQLCITYLGGTTEDDLDSGGEIAIYDNSLYITASTAGGYPVTPGAFQTVHTGGNLTDAFIGKLCINICEAKVSGLDYTSSSANVCTNAPVTFTSIINSSCDTSGYKFQWTFPGGSPSSSAATTPLVTYAAPGSYAVKLVLTTACKKDSVVKSSYITVTNCGCTLSAVTSVVSNINCSGSAGSANVIISNGAGPYTYSWSNGSSGVTFATVISATGLLANTYTVTINEGSCFSISTVTITQALTISSVTAVNVTCNGAGNGNATAAISGSGGTYTYSWSNGVSSITTATSHVVNNLVPGTYTVTISRGGCLSTSMVTITQPPLIVSGISAQWICPANSGTSTLYPANGNPPYTYLWSNGQTTSTVSGLSAGTYSVTLTDASGCSSTRTAQIGPPSIKVSSVNISCTTGGSATVTPTGGVSPFIYSWSHGPTASTVSGLLAGNYTVSVTDGNGCIVTHVFNITGTSSASATFSQSPTGIICIGTTVNFTNTGSVGAGVTYNWRVVPGSGSLVSGTTANFSYKFLAVGSYSVTDTVKSGGCLATFSRSISVINCSGPTVTAVGSSVCSGSCATVTSNGVGGTTPYTYTWSNSATTQNINPCPVSTTTYTVTIRDSGGNTSTSTAVVTVNPPLTATVSPTQITCNGSANGSVSASGSSGTIPYVYNWSNGQTTQVISGLTAGNYTVTITDSKGCSSISTAAIISPSAIVGRFAKGTAGCAGCGCKQWVLVNAIGGTSPYTYAWPDGYINRYKNQLCPGNYTINIKDKNGCSVNVNLISP